jgi:hypothetical protein
MMLNVVLIVLGAMAIAVGGYFGRRAGALESELVTFRTSQFRGFDGRWPAPPDLRYRPEGWPLVAALRRELFRAYVFVGAGAMLLLYACPRVR